MEGKSVYKVKLIHKSLIAYNLLELRFEKPEHFLFKAGQFVQFFIPDGLESVLRSYSIASSPNEDYLEFCIKLVPEGKGARFFTKLGIGEDAQFQGPEGRFTCEDYFGKSKLFVATGAGLAPIMSMLKAELNENNNVVQLIFGVRSEKDLFWVDRLENLKVFSSQFIFQTTLSQPGNTWRGARGRVTELVSSLDRKFDKYYLCGSLEMVKDVRGILTKRGVEVRNVHLEIF